MSLKLAGRFGVLPWKELLEAECNCITLFFEQGKISSILKKEESKNADPVRVLHTLFSVSTGADT